jgi:hypothetical protein
MTVNNKLRKIWDEAVAPQFEVWSWSFLEGLSKTMKTSVRIAGLRAKIWTWDLPNTKQEW